MKKKLLMSLVMLLAMSMLLVGCGSSDKTSGGSNDNGEAASSDSDNTSDTNSNSSDDNTILVGTDTTFPPFESEKDGKPIGFDIDMIKAIAEKEGLKIDQIKAEQFTGLIPGLQSGAIDVAVAGITIKNSRLESVNFSNAYYKSGLSVIVKSDSDYTGLDDLKGHLVGTKKGTTSVDYLKDHGFKDKDIKQYDDTNGIYQAVATGGIDAGLFDNPTNADYAAKHNNLKVVGGLLTGEYYGIAISKKRPELVDKINDGLAKLVEDGTYDEIYKKYFGDEESGKVKEVKSPEDVSVDD